MIRIEVKPEDIVALFNSDSPQFSQREASKISGADVSWINNWIQRGLVKLEPVNGRPQKGRRLFSRQQVLLFKMIAACIEGGIPVSDALAISARVYTETSNALKSGRLIFEVPGKGAFLMWLIVCGHREHVAGAVQGSSGTYWSFEPATSPMHMMMFSNMDGDALEISPDRSRKTLTCLPLALLVHDVAHGIAELLASEAIDQPE